MRGRKPWIVCAAIKLHEGTIICGARHHDPIMNRVLRIIGNSGRPAQGFIDQWGNFLTREEALRIAHKNGQVLEEGHSKTELFSEDLY